MRRLAPFALAALLALSLLPGLAAVDALDGREARDLVTAYESTDRREWLTPIYAHAPLYEKPIAAYVLEILARRLLARLVPGVPADVLDVACSRCVRALAAALLAFVVAGIGRRAFGARAGWLAGGVFASMLGLPLAARADGGQVVATLCAWAGSGRLLDVLAGRARDADAALAAGWLALGAAAAAAGPLPALWPLAGFGLYFALARDHGGWRALRPLAGLAIVAGVALPWYGAMTALHGRAFLAHVAWYPYATGVRGGWLAGPALALTFVIVASLPWTPVFGAALNDGAARLRGARAMPPGVADPDHAAHVVLALQCAAAVPIALYPGPPLTAALPALPAVALLVGRFADRVLAGDADPRLLSIAAWLLAPVGTAIALLGAALSLQLPDAAAALRLLAAVTLVTACAPAIALHAPVRDRARARRFALALFALPVALGAPLLYTRALPALEPWLNAHAVADAMQRVSPPRAPLVVFEPPPPSLRATLARNFVSRPGLDAPLADAVARDGEVYVAFRPAHESLAARTSPVPLEILLRTPTLVLARIHVRAPR